MPETPDYPHDLSQEVLVPADGLRELITKLLVKKGMFAAEAQVAAARLVEADLRGIQSHGCRALPTYIKAIDEGNIDPRGQVLKVTETPAMAVLDGGRNLGHVASTKAMQMAIEKAKNVGTGTVAVKNSQHFGAASVYTLMATQAGMLGYCTTSTGRATVAAYGSSQPGTANNALSWGAPTRSGSPFILDMACAVSSWGKVHAEKFYGGVIPGGWALDEHGQPTTDPFAAKILLPAAGARGYGLALVSAILAGTLVGGKMPIHKNRATEVEGSEHFFYAIDISKFTDLDTYYAEMDQSLADIRALSPAPGFDKVRIPGELEDERMAQWSETGIPLHRQPLQELAELAQKYKFPLPW